MIIKRGKRGQMEIPFSMIFSIILIVVFIGVAIYAVNFFLNLKKCSETGMFKQEFQDAVDRAWNSPETSETFKNNLPSSIEYVCFLDLNANAKGEKEDYYDELTRYSSGKENMFFYPPEKACEGQITFEIKHINIESITEKNNPFCIKNVNGKISFKIDKGLNDALVIIS